MIASLPGSLQRSQMLRICVREYGSKALAETTPQPRLRKCQFTWEAGQGFPDSGLYRSETPIIEVMGKAPLSWLGQMCALLAVLACIGLTGCAGVSSAGQNANSSSNPSPTQNPNPTNPNPAGAGQLSVSPTTMNFGNVAVGSQNTLTGTLTAGSSDVSVSSANSTGQGYTVSGITFPVTVAAGTSVNYTVTFTPQVAGSTPGSVSFVNDGTSSPVVQTLDGDGAQAGAHSVALSWNASTSAVIGYNIYRGTQSGGPYQQLTSSPQTATSYTDDAVSSGTTYYYVSTAVDSSYTESSYSNQAQAVIP
jgi:hypothetical protein